MDKEKGGEEIRYIVRVCNKDLNGRLPIERALCGIKGMGTRTAAMVASAFERETKIPALSKLGRLNEESCRKLEEIVVNPSKYGVPHWALNRQKDIYEGNDTHLVENELDFGLRRDFQRLAAIKSYRGLRHSWGLTVRGQRTRSTHRGKGGVVGVVKKDVKKAAEGKKGGGEKKEGEKKK